MLSEGENFMAKMVNVGFGNVVSADRVIAIMTPESAQTKRIVAQAKEEHKFLDASHGRRTRAVIVIDSGHVIVSGLMPATIGDRMARNTVTMIKEITEKGDKFDEEGVTDGNIGSKRNG